jgi:hypothetical protein
MMKKNYSSAKQERQQRQSGIDYRQAHFTVAYIADEVTPFFNPKSRIIALKHKGQIYWAYLLIGNDYPDPRKHKLMWLRFREVDAAPANQPVPDSFPDNMPFSMALTVPAEETPHLIDSTGTSAMQGGYIRDGEAQQRVYPGKTDGDSSGRSGLVFNEDSGSVLLKGAYNEITLDKGGISFNGPLLHNDMQRRGIFAENPLSYVIPETIVTFPVSQKYFPDPSMIEQVGSWLSLLNDARSIIKAIKDL